MIQPGHTDSTMTLPFGQDGPSTPPKTRTPGTRGEWEDPNDINNPVLNELYDTTHIHPEDARYEMEGAVNSAKRHRQLTSEEKGYVRPKRRKH